MVLTDLSCCEVVTSLGERKIGLLNQLKEGWTSSGYGALDAQMLQ